MEPHPRPSNPVRHLAFLPLLVMAWSDWGSLTAAPVTVINPGFEDIAGESVVSGVFTFGPLNGWDLYDPGGITGGGVGNTYFVGTLLPNPPTSFTAGAPEGQRVGLAFNRSGSGNQGEYGLEQTLAATLQANTRYTLSLGIGNIASDSVFNLDGFPGDRVDLLAGGVVLEQDNNSLAGSIAEGSFETSVLQFESSATHAQLGLALQIRLVNLNQIDSGAPGANLEVNFDDISLTATNATAVPEPASVVILSCLGLGWFVRRSTRKETVA